MSGRRAEVGFVLTILVAASSVGPASAQEPSSSPTAGGHPAASLPPEASALAAEAQAILAEVLAQAASSPEEAVAAARATQIERTGLAEIDPGLAATLTQLEAQAGQGFATFLEELPPLPGPELSGEPFTDASSDPSPSPEAATSAFLAAVAPGPGEREPRFAQGGSTLSSIGQVLGWVRSEVGSFKPSKGSGSSSSDPFVRGGSRYRITKAWERDTLTLIIEMTEQYDVPGATPEAPGFSVTDTGGTTLQVDTCPDEDGTIVVTANASGTYDVAGEDLGYHATLDTRDVATVTVNDDAEIEGREHALTVRGTASGDRPAFAGGAGAVASQLDASMTWSGETSSAAAPAVTITTAEGLDARDLRSAFTSGAFTAALVDAAIDAAATVWQGGRCLKLNVDPPGREVDSGSETEITVKIEHKAFDEEVDRDVTAELEGTETVEPADEPVRAPAVFTYMATSESEGEGTITFRSVSNRGVAEERAETYTVSQRLLLDAEGSVTMDLGGMKWRNTYKARGLKIVMEPGDTPDAPPRVSVEGEIDLRGRVRGLLGRANCTGSFRARSPIDPGLDVSAQLVGEGDDRRLSIHLWTSEPDATIDFPLRCRFPTGPTRVPYSIQVRDTWPIWSGIGTPVELPLTGGSASDRQQVGAARYDSSLTLREEER
jgi:hypothetical protein